MNYNI